MISKKMDLSIDFRCECGECEGCCKNWEWKHDSFTLEEGVKLAEHNYECQVFNELEKQKPWEL